MQPFVGQIILFAGNFAPRGWAFCDGQTLDIAEHQPLFAILGTTYGGDGQLTFKLPDLRGRVPMHSGDGPGLTPRDLGQTTGTETVALTATELPEHRHEFYVTEAEPTTGAAEGGILSAVGSVVAADQARHRQSAAPDVNLHTKTIGLAGGSAPHDNMQPSICMNYIIALQGQLPARN
ncbi:MAG: tail fiber protein [Pseudomonadota bacterium]